MKIHWIFRVVSLFNYQGCLLLSKRLRYFIITCFVCQALFSSFLNFFVWSFSNRRAFWQLRYFIISFSVCQVFFWSFLTFFFHPTASSSQLFVVCFWFLTGSLFYHVLICLSSTFLHFNIVWLFLSHSIFQTASTFYHIVFTLSSIF